MAVPSQISLKESTQTKGDKGERIAERRFKKFGWKVKKRGYGHAPFDFIVETRNGRTYAVNVKYGNFMSIRLRNMERLKESQYPLAFLWITENRKVFFLLEADISSQ